jgi:hypothetical protein
MPNTFSMRFVVVAAPRTGIGFRDNLVAGHRIPRSAMPSLDTLGKLGSIDKSNFDDRHARRYEGKTQSGESGYVPRFCYDRNARNRISAAAIEMLNIPAA